MTYPEMKSSDVQWIGDIPSHWNVSKAKYHVVITNGSDPETEGDIPVYGSGAESFKTCGEYKEGPAVLIGRKGATLHIPHFIEGRYWNADTAFDVKARKDYSLRYFYYSACCFDYKYYISQTTLPSMTQSNYANMKIPVPSIQEQNNITAFLDMKCAEIDAIIADAKASIDEYKRWKASVIYQAVTKGLDPNADMRESLVKGMGPIPAHWNLMPLKYIATLDPACQTSHITDNDEVTFVPMECVRTDKRIPRIALKSNDNGTYSSFVNGDIAIAKVTPCFENGNICVMENLVNGYAFGSSELFAVRARTIQTRFLFYYLQSLCFINGAIATMTGVGGLKRVSSYYMKNARVPIPPSMEQSEIITHLDKQCSNIDAIISEKQSLIAELEAYKKSLIYEAVTGKRKVG